MTGQIDRRSLLSRSLWTAGAVLGGTLSGARIAFASAATQRRLVFIIQRGAADGLGTLAPVGDKALSGLRGELSEDFAGQPLMSGMFALHPALEQVGTLYGAKQALFAHAVASPYRDRSHFDGQNVLETGGTQPYDRKDGWLNRLLSLLPPAEAKGLAISPAIPAALRGPVQVASYAPSALPPASSDLIQRLSMLYASDAPLHGLWEEALQTRAMAGDQDARGKRDGAATGKMIASLMTGAQGARVVMAETEGWDTHSNQRGRLRSQLTALDAMIGGLRDGLGPAWNDTLVIVATEFGRTAAANGTGGTDHGTASLAMMLGGTVAGGRILSDWPGLAQSQLYEGRDLRPTQSLDGLMAGAVAAHFNLDPMIASARLFPGGSGRGAEGLVLG